MCLALPLKLIKIEGKNGVGERGGVGRDVRLDFIKEPALGDYVLVHAGFAIEKLDPVKAAENLEAYEELDAAMAEIRQAVKEIEEAGGRY